jgi:hypothetical protein
MTTLPGGNFPSTVVTCRHARHVRRELPGKAASSFHAALVLRSLAKFHFKNQLSLARIARLMHEYVLALHGWRASELGYDRALKPCLR